MELPLFDEFVTKSNKLQNQLKVFSSFFNVFPSRRLLEGDLPRLWILPRHIQADCRLRSKYKRLTLMILINIMMPIIKMIIFTMYIFKVYDDLLHFPGSSTDLGICLTRILVKQRSVEDHLKTFVRFCTVLMKHHCNHHDDAPSALTDCCTFPLQSRREEWRRRVCFIFTIVYLFIIHNSSSLFIPCLIRF